MGGAERHVYDLALSLSRERYEPTVCFLGRAEIYGDLLRSAGIPVREMALRRGSDLPGIVRYVRWLRTERFDIVHDHLSAPWARPVSSWAGSGALLVATEHSGKLLEGYGVWRRFWCRRSARCTGRTIVVSEAMRRALLRIVPEHAARTEIIPNAVDGARFPPRTERERDALRRSLGLAAGAPVLLAAGRLEAEKGFDRLLPLLSPAFAALPDLHLLIAGEGILRGGLEREAERRGLSGRVRLLGVRQDVPALCDLADLLVLASRVESFGIVAAEAMMAGRPVLGPRIPGLEEVVDAGRTGVLVDPARLEEDFAAEVLGLLRDPDRRLEMGRAGRQAALDRFERKRVASRIQRVYEEVMRGVGRDG